VSAGGIAAIIIPGLNKPVNGIFRNLSMNAGIQYAIKTFVFKKSPCAVGIYNHRPQVRLQGIQHTLTNSSIENEQKENK
jgi:hypothetical protein